MHKSPATTTRARSLRRRMSPPEARMWNLLRSEPFAALQFRRQVPIGPYYADFAAHGLRLVIEIDGAQHFTDAAIAYDTRRTAFLEAAGYRVPALQHRRCAEPSGRRRGTGARGVPPTHRWRGPPSAGGA